jgi:folate-dependent phosphoribosylglycinamide formyltransferase PurN
MNIVMLCTSGLTNYNINVITCFLNDKRFKIVGCVIDNRPSKKLFQKLRFNLRRGRGGYTLIMLLKLFSKRKETIVETTNFFHKKNIQTISTVKPYSEGTLSQIKKICPDLLILISGFGIVKKPLINFCTNGILSYHHGNMRKYRGMPPAFWEIYNGEREVGVTVQRINEGLDHGEPILERNYSIEYGESLQSVREKIFHNTEDLMYLAAKKVSSNKYSKKFIEQYGKVYTLPNLRQWMYFNLKQFVRNIVKHLR